MVVGLGWDAVSARDAQSSFFNYSEFYKNIP